MFEVLESIPAYSSETENHITREAYNEAVSASTSHLNRAFELFTAYWKNGNERLFDMSLEELGKAETFMDTIMCAVADNGVVDKISKRATFMYDLAAAMLGRK